jgi:hypothetical protein
MKDVKARSCSSSKFQRIQMLGLPRTQCETVVAETALDVEQMSCSAAASAGTAALWKTPATTTSSIPASAVGIDRFLHH